MHNIDFKVLDKEHLEWARILHNDSEVLAMLTDPTVVSPEAQEKWFSNLQESKSSERWIVMVENRPAGLVRLDGIDSDNKSICIGLDISSEFRGKGLAKLVYRKLFEEWFVNRGFNRIWLLVASYNTRAHNLYKKLGFIEEGIQRERLLKNGIFHDYIMMSVLKKEYTGVNNG